MPDCKRCGTCCRANGLIPPLVPGDDVVPDWFGVMIRNLRRHVGGVAESPGFACIFLDEADNSCAIHAKCWRPSVCRNYPEAGTACQGSEEPPHGE